MIFELCPVGMVRRGDRPAVDNDWGASRAVIELDQEQFGPEALAWLDGFSHAEITTVFHRPPYHETETAARHQIGRIDQARVAISAQRRKNRPNRLGATICRILSVDSTSLEVEGLDAIDGTPVLDIKPKMREL